MRRVRAWFEDVAKSRVSFDLQIEKVETIELVDETVRGVRACTPNVTKTLRFALEHRYGDQICRTKRSAPGMGRRQVRTSGSKDTSDSRDGTMTTTDSTSCWRRISCYGLVFGLFSNLVSCGSLRVGTL